MAQLFSLGITASRDWILLFGWQAAVLEVMVRALPDFEVTGFMSILAADLRQLPASFSPWDFCRRIFVSFRRRLMPNKSPEPTAVGAGSSAVAVHVTSRRWLSFLR